MDPNEWTAENVATLLCNPFYAITIDGGLFGEHEPIIGRDEWIDVNAKLIEERGAAHWLGNLLAVLEGGFIRSEADAPPLTANRNDPCPCGSGKKFKVCHGR